MNKKTKSHIQMPFMSVLLIAIAMILASCVQGQGGGKKQKIKDFSIVTDFNGCTDSFLLMDNASPSVCVTECSDGTHLASTDEMTELKATLTADKNEELLGFVTNSKNVCLPDVVVEKRPTMQVEVKNDFCACLNGKPDVINDCEATCASKPVTTEPMLYVNTTVGTDIALNEKLKNLHNWCTVQLASDDTAPQCVLQAYDGSTTLNLPVSTSAGSNSFTSSLNLLAYDRTYIMKIIETKAGSNAQSKEFQIRRKKATATDDTVSGVLKVANISQYSCISYGGTTNNGVVKRVADTYARYYYYYPANETPAPMAPPAPGNDTIVVCHNEQLNGTRDDVEFARLENIPLAFSLWDKADTRFATTAGKMKITKILEDRLASEFPNSGIVGASLFTPLKIGSRPDTTSITQGYFMIPFTDQQTGKSYCPTAEQLQGTGALFSILGDYIVDTEGFYLAEKEAEQVLSGGSYKTIYGTILVTETTVKKFGFYIENGLKIKASATSMNTKTIHFYWPTSTEADALTAGGRKLFTVRTPDTLAGQSPIGATEGSTSDKRLGCIPKSTN
jgi:hypothetical protein